MNLIGLYAKTHKELGMKGIQLESMGFTYLVPSIESGNKDLLTSWYKLYDTYLSWSAADSKTMKVKAMMEY